MQGVLQNPQAAAGKAISSYFPSPTNFAASERIAVSLLEPGMEDGKAAKLLAQLDKFSRSNASCGLKIRTYDLVATVALANGHGKVRDKAISYLAGEIAYLSNTEKYMSVRSKIETLLSISPDVALDKKILPQIQKAIRQQAAYVEKAMDAMRQEQELLSSASNFAKTYQVNAPLGSRHLKWAAYGISHNAQKTGSLVLDRANDRKRGAPLKDSAIPDNLREASIAYYEGAKGAALHFLKNSRNGSVREFASTLAENCGDFINSAKEAGGDRRKIAAGLITFERLYLQPAMEKISSEKYWDGLYASAGGDKFLKALVWGKKHSQTGMLWTAFGASIACPPLGRVMFGMLGAKQAAEGIAQQDFEMALFGLSMMGGFVRNAPIRMASTVYLNSAIIANALEIIENSQRTGFGSMDLEQLANDAVLLAGYFKARAKSKMEAKAARAELKVEVSGDLLDGEATLKDGTRLKIRRIMLRDALDEKLFNSMYELLRKSFRESEIESKEDYREFIHDEFAETFYMDVAYIGGKVVGAGTFSYLLEVNAAMGNVVAVDPAYRGKGVSKALKAYRDIQCEHAARKAGTGYDYTYAEIDIPWQSPEPAKVLRDRMAYHNDVTKVRLPLLPRGVGARGKNVANRPLIYYMPDMAEFMENPETAQSFEELYFAIGKRAGKNNKITGKEIYAALKYYYFDYLVEECDFTREKMTELFLRTMYRNFSRSREFRDAFSVRKVGTLEEFDAIFTKSKLYNMKFDLAQPKIFSPGLIPPPMEIRMDEKIRKLQPDLP